MSKLEDKALDYLEKFEEFAKQYKPDVVDATLKVIQINGLKEIIIGLVLIVIGGISAYFCNSFIKSYTKHNDHENVAVMFCFVSVITLILGLFYLADIWNYVAILNQSWL